jgi:hypothetical protein
MSFKVPGPLKAFASGVKDLAQTIKEHPLRSLGAAGTLGLSELGYLYAKKLAPEVQKVAEVVKEHPLRSAAAVATLGGSEVGYLYGKKAVQGAKKAAEAIKKHPVRTVGAIGTLGLSELGRMHVKKGIDALKNIHKFTPEDAAQKTKQQRLDTLEGKNDIGLTRNSSANFCIELVNGMNTLLALIGTKLDPNANLSKFAREMNPVYMVASAIHEHGKKSAEQTTENVKSTGQTSDQPEETPENTVDPENTEVSPEDEIEPDVEIEMVDEPPEPKVGTQEVGSEDLSSQVRATAEENMHKVVTPFTGKNGPSPQQITAQEKRSALQEDQSQELTEDHSSSPSFNPSQ